MWRPSGGLQSSSPPCKASMCFSLSALMKKHAECGNSRPAQHVRLTDLEQNRQISKHHLKILFLDALTITNIYDSLVN